MPGPLKVLYVNGAVDPVFGDALKHETKRRLAASKAAESRGLEFVSMDLFGERLRPLNMGRFAREQSPDAIILSGSDKNTTDREDPWVQEYLTGLRDLLEVPSDMAEWAGPPCPILGICFGHQALACALGGETARFQRRVAVVELTTLSTARRHGSLKKLFQADPNRKLRAAVYHADHVVRIPPDFCPLFTSPYCEVQGMAHRDWPIISYQSHPEMGADVVEVPGERELWTEEHPDPVAALNAQDGPAIMADFLNWVSTIR